MAALHRVSFSSRGRAPRPRAAASAEAPAAPAPSPATSRGTPSRPAVPLAGNSRVYLSDAVYTPRAPLPAAAERCISSSAGSTRLSVPNTARSAEEGRTDSIFVASRSSLQLRAWLKCRQRLSTLRHSAAADW
eukprot:scaffold36612_cov56-Phaeocystis_antarctica.AAC.2